MEDIFLKFQESAQEYGISVTNSQLGQFQIYMEALLSWNEKVNLTTITEPAEVTVKHFLDSILILHYYDLPLGAKIIDVGTGAGFPGLPLKILRPDLSVTLLDSLNKRLIFICDLLTKLGVKCNVVHARAEEYGRIEENRQAFDFVVSRAVAKLPALCEYCLPFVKIGGVFVSMKGPDIGEELESAENAVKLLGCTVSSVENYRLPGGDGRSLVIIKRISPLSKEYPRRGVKISKKPLG